jgi:hypothetical protein
VTTTLQTPSTPTATDPVTGRVLTMLGGLSMIAAPLLFVAGAATSPPQTDNSPASYIDSLGNDPFLTAVSANLFHYSWVLFAAAALAAIGLVRGPRGRRLALAGGLAAAFGSIQFTGLIYSDWVLEALDNQLSPSDAVSIFEHVNGSASITVWMLSAKLFGLLGFPLLFAGLARAGVISGWLVPLSLLPMVAFGVVGGVLGIVLAIGCYAPNFVAGTRLLQRAGVRSSHR